MGWWDKGKRLLHEENNHHLCTSETAEASPVQHKSMENKRVLMRRHSFSRELENDF